MPSIIYSIRSPKLPNKEYIGCSDLAPTMRMQRHLTAYKRYTTGKSTLYCSSFDIIGAGESSLIVLETLENPTRIQLHVKEGEVINNAPTRGMTVVNKRRAGVNSADIEDKYKRSVKKWYEDFGCKDYSCECGAKVRLANKKIHTKTKKHQAFKMKPLIEAINEIMAIGEIF